MPSYAQDALVDVSAAVKALRQVEPEAAKVLMARYLFEEDMATIGRNLRDPVTGTPKTRAAVSKLSVSGVSWISGYLEKL